MSKNNDKNNMVHVEREVDYYLCFLCDCLFMFEAAFTSGCYSDEINKIIVELKNQVKKELGVLECHELQGEYVVQYGYKRSCDKR